MVQKILFINDNGNALAGSEISLFEVLRSIDRKNFCPMVLCYTDGVFVDRLRLLEVPVLIKKFFHYNRTVNPFLLFIQLIRYVKDVCRLIYILKKEKIELVHANKSVCAPIVVVAARIAGVRCVWHVRTFAKHLGKIARILIEMCDRVIFVSEAAQKIYRDTIPELIGKFEVVYNRVGVPLIEGKKNVLRSELQLSEEDVLIGMIAHFVPCKKQEDFLLCAIKVLEKYPRARFIIAGGILDVNPHESDSIKTYKQMLDTMYRQYNLHGKLFFLGQLNDIGKVYADLDILIVVSKYETFGRVAVEAALSHVPIIAYRGGGLPEIFEEGKEIKFVSCGDIDQLAENIFTLLEEKQVREQQVLDAYKKALQYQSDESVRRIERIYREILEKGKK